MFYPGSLYQILIEKLGVPVSAIINAARGIWGQAGCHDYQLYLLLQINHKKYSWIVLWLSKNKLSLSHYQVVLETVKPVTV